MITVPSIFGHFSLLVRPEIRPLIDTTSKFGQLSNREASPDSEVRPLFIALLDIADDEYRETLHKNQYLVFNLRFVDFDVFTA